MLDPYFFSTPTELGFNLDAPDLRYWVIGYVQVGEFTLVSWRFGNQEEYFQGENLYKNRDLILCSGGVIPLPTEIMPEDYQSLDPWDRVNFSLWETGITQNIALQLRDPINYVMFEP